MPPKAPAAPTRTSRRLRGEDPDTAPLRKKDPKPPKGKKPRDTQDDSNIVSSKIKKTKRGPESNPEGGPPSKKKKKNTAGGTEANQGEPTNPAHDVQSTPPEGKRPKGKKGGDSNGSKKTKAAEGTNVYRIKVISMLTSSCLVHPKASDNLRRRLCSLWRDDSNVITSLSDLQVHHSRETFLDSHNRYVLTEQTIMLAIAALWQGIAGADMRYSFGSSRLFANARIEGAIQDGDRSVPESDILLVPLFFGEEIINPERDDQGALLPTNQPRHGVIAVAHKDADSNITFTFMYSPPRHSTKAKDQPESELDRAVIHQSALEIVRRSGWLPEYEYPRYDKELDIWVEVPPAFADALEDDTAIDNAPERWNTMGHHMVLNAWAYMLDISIEPEIPYTFEGGAWDLFYTITDDLIALALQGRVNGNIIKQFMTEFRYAKAESDKTASRRITDNDLLTRLRRESSVLMNQAIFDRILERLQQDMSQAMLPRSRHLAAISQEPAKKPGPSVPKGGTKPITPPKKGTKATSSKGEPRTWRQTFDHNIATHEKAAAKLPKAKDQLEAPAEGLYLDSLVWQAIMSVWSPLWDSGHRYAFGTEDLCTHMRDEAHARTLSRWAVGNSTMPLILPLRGHGRGFTFGEAEAFQADPEDNTNAKGGKDGKDGKQDKKGKKGEKNGKAGKQDKEGKKGDKGDKAKEPAGGVGHWIFAVATFDKKENRVTVRHFNSANWTRSKGIERAAEGAVRFSGWLGLRPTGAGSSPEPVPFTGTFDHLFESVPQQENGRDCGLHVIMSAWATLLNIPIGTGRPFAELRKRAHPRDRFYQEGQRVIDCALAGCMNMRTIQAFLNVHRFSVAQDPESEVDKVVRENVMPVVTEDTCGEAYELGRMAPLS